MEAINKKENQFTYFKFFFRILRFKFLLAISMNIFIGLLDGIGLTILFPLLQSVESRSSGASQATGQLKFIFTSLEQVGLPLTINVILSIFLILFTLKAFVKYWATRYQSKVQLVFVKKIQLDFLKNFRCLSYKGFLQLDAGRIHNTLVAEIWRVSEAMKHYLRWSNSLLLLLTYVSLAFLANVEFALFITVGVGLMNIFYRKVYKKVKAASYETSQKGVDLNSYLIEIVHYFKYLKSTSYLEAYSKRLKRIINERFNIDFRLGKLSALIVSIKEPTIIFVVVAVIMFQVNFVGGSISSIFLSLLLFYRGLSYLISLQSDWQNFLHQSGAFRMVSEVTGQMKSFEEKSGNVQFTSIKNHICLENVSLSFGKTPILEDISIEIPRNTSIALIGVSGSGKTTLVNLISGLLKPDKGKVLVDNMDLNDYDQNSYRSKIGYISQEPVVFNDTIFNNITFWAEPTIENKKLFWEVVEMASLTEFIENQELQENTPLGDNGILISGGQRQRISIARELYKRPEILILDEATSALDSETERIIQENIENLQGSYTMIIIAHRLSTVRKVDNIYLIEKGNVSSSGAFDELVEGSAKFRNMVSLQKVME